MDDNAPTSETFRLEAYKGVPYDVTDVCNSRGTEAQLF
jgi:hypothetical protein